jgi:hypothetical protein
VWYHTPVTPVMMGSIKQEDHGPGKPEQKARSYLQNKQSKRS